ncbi:MAG: response regulator transcription factor [Lachnospiraceae bacterium]|nr:response regulator transcription factor [Lachnospiraceae bacterium]
MYRVLFADDESSIRRGIKCLLDWESMGFSTDYEAENGQEALDIIKKYQPDLILLDIRMPKLHGTEVIKAAREAGFTGKCIILSGYSDFTYAQTAIRYNVDFYLTKPIDEDDLLEAVTYVKKLLDDERSKDTYIDVYRNKARDVILKEIITGVAEEKTYEQPALDELGLNFDTYQVVIYENYSKKLSSLTYDFAELLNITNTDNKTFECTRIDQNDVILLKGAVSLKQFNDFLDHYDSTPPQAGSPMDTIFICYGSPVSSVKEISESYDQALSLINRRFFCAQGQHTLSYDELPKADAKDNQLSNKLLTKYAELLTDHLQTYNRKRVAETLYALEEYLYTVNDTIDSVKLFMTDLYLQIKETISHLYGAEKIPFPTNSSIIELISTKYYLYEIILFFSGQFEMIMNATGNSSRDSILDDVIYYIDHNYQNNIKLETIAPLFGYNSAYLGKIFNKAVNESFNSYVDHIRIEHSKELLKQNKLKVYEISERIGYNNVDYFHKKFKKYVGMSPAEYRRSLLLPDE